jgi:NADPH:quinone reductase-like Zn-dependent oxidoreductase
MTHAAEGGNSVKAEILTGFGGAENFELADVPVPVPAAGQVLVRVAAIGINSLEWKIRNGWLERAFPTPLPAILGKEVAGTVEALGDENGDLAVGDRVVGFADSGAYAEYAVAHAEALAAVPDALPFENAVALPVAVETAVRGIRSLGILPGWTVVVNGAAGVVGSAVVQLLVSQGARVIGTASAANHDLVAELGAVPVTYGDGAADRIRALSPQPIDAVYDAAGHGFAAAAIGLTGDPHRVLTIADFEAAPLGIQVSTGSRKPTAEAFAPVVPMAASGEFRIMIDRIFAFTDIAAAHVYGERGPVRGKIVVTV